MEIRLASIDDAEAVRKIYAPYVLNTAISFEYEVPSVDELKSRIKNTLEQYPYLVIVEDGVIVGYAYAGPFHSREAYKRSVELSVYIDMECRRKGYGESLYNRLMQMLAEQNIYNVHACIASPDGEDEHLTNDSELFHSRMGFVTAGRHDRCGYKFGKWYSIVWMDKVIKEKVDNPGQFIPFSQMNKE